MRAPTKQIYSNIREEELTPDLKMIAEIIGVDNVVKLLEELQGISFYIPKITRLDSFIQRYINENKSKPIKQIAIELGVTEVFLKNFLKRKI